MIGRIKEKRQLNDVFASSQSEFVAVYGRRRIGKTYLITETFENRFAFHHTGLKEQGTRRQLEHFRLSLRQQGRTAHGIRRTLSFVVQASAEVHGGS